MKPETMLNLIEMLMERISDMEGANSLAVYLKDTYHTQINELMAERDKLKAENHTLIAENDHLKAALVEKQTKLSEATTEKQPELFGACYPGTKEAYFAAVKGVLADDED